MKVKQHSFSIDLAEKIGVEKAVLMANIHYWLDWAASHGKNINDGYHWTYNSSTGFAKLFPYWSAKKISNMLRSLEDEGYLISGSFNKAGYDRTKWYTTSDYLIVQNGTMDCTEWDNGSPKTGQPIPNNKPPLKPDVKTPMSKKDFDVEFVIDHLNKVCGTKYRSSTKSHAKEIRGRLSDGHSVEDIKKVIDRKFVEWGANPDMAQYLRPQTLFSASKFQGYLTAANTKPANQTSLHNLQNIDYGQPRKI